MHLLIIVWCLFFSPNKVLAQPDSPYLAIPDAPVCSQCTIVLDSSGHVLDPPDSIHILRQPLPEVFITESNLLFIAPASPTIPIAAFTLDGSLFASYGRFDDDEWHLDRRRRFIITNGPDRSVITVQGTTAIVFSPRTGEPAERIDLALQPHSVYAMGDTLLLLRSLITGVGQREYLHYAGPTGSLIASFGASTDDMAVDAYFRDRKVMGIGRDALSIWLGDVNRYEMRQYTRSGQMSLRVRRDSEWFHPYYNYVPEEPFSQPPRPRITSISDRGPDTLYVTISVADEAWTPHIGGAALGRPVTQAFDLDSVYDTVVEAIDVQEGVVIARRRFDEYLVDAGAGYLASVVARPEGRFGIAIWRPNLKPQ